MSYYNTTNETGITLKRSKGKASRQEDIILDVFKRSPEGLTPFEVHKKVLSNSPITSVRRAITTLTSEGKLIKTEQKRIGIYGKQTFVWRFLTDPI